MAAQDLVADGVEAGLAVTLVDQEEDVDAVEGPHRLDGDLVRVPRTDADDEQFTHALSVAHASLGSVGAHPRPGRNG